MTDLAKKLREYAQRSRKWNSDPTIFEDADEAADEIERLNDE